MCNANNGFDDKDMFIRDAEKVCSIFMCPRSDVFEGKYMFLTYGYKVFNVVCIVIKYIITVF